MIDYEVSVQPTAISRNWDEDVDPHEEGYLPAAPAVEAKLLLVSGDGDGRGAGAPPPPPKPVRARNLVVGLRGAGALFVEQCLLGGGGGNGAPPPVGALVLPAPGGRAAATVEEAAEEPETALLHRAAADGNTLLLAVHYEVAAESARGWAMALLGGLEVERCVVLDSVMSHSFYTAEVDAPVPPALFKLESAAHAEAKLATVVPMLPPPNHAVGAAAAVLTRLLYAGAAGAVFLSIQDAQDASAHTLEAFTAVVDAYGLGWLNAADLAAGCNAAEKLSARSPAASLRNRMYL